MGIAEDLERLRQFEDDDGEIEQLADSFEKAFAASPLRRQIKEQQKTIDKLHDFAVRASFKEAGLNVEPSVLNLPDDFDPTDPEALRTWAAESGVYAMKPDFTPDEQAQHERVEEAVTGAAPTGGSTRQTQILEELDPTKLTEQEFWAKANELKVTLESQQRQ